MTYRDTSESALLFKELKRTFLNTSRALYQTKPTDFKTSIKTAGMSERDCVDGDWAGIDFSGEDLTEIDFSYSDLRGCDFDNADLENTNTFGALFSQEKTIRGALNARPGWKRIVGYANSESGAFVDSLGRISSWYAEKPGARFRKNGYSQLVLSMKSMIEVEHLTLRWGRTSDIDLLTGDGGGMVLLRGLKGRVSGVAINRANHVIAWSDQGTFFEWDLSAWM